MSDKFTVHYSISDGYAGGSRPHSFNFFADDLEDDMGEIEIVDALEMVMQDHFSENIYPYATNKDDFLQWAKKKIAERGDE